MAPDKQITPRNTVQQLNGTTIGERRKLSHDERARGSQGSRPLAVADLDVDGCPDVVIVDFNEGVTVLFGEACGPDDSDDDAVEDGTDNCGLASNPDQADADGDGMGDLCDPCPAVAGDHGDKDEDGIGDACDLCPLLADDQADGDSDGAGDACDVCPELPDDQADRDGDGAGDACDVCPENGSDQCDAAAARPAPSSEPGGCGCAQQPAPPRSVVWCLGAVGVAALRRRRVVSLAPPVTSASFNTPSADS